MPIIKTREEKYLNKETDIKHKDIITLQTEGQWEESDNFKKEDGTPSNQFSILVKLSGGEIRSTILNWTNVKILVSVFGENSANWVGKELRAWKTKSEKAKLGYTYIYVPTDWDRDDTGEWIIPQSNMVEDDTTKKINEALETINAEDIPF
jgi:hypothetical protein